jgi:hypothetical protein
MVPRSRCHAARTRGQRPFRATSANGKREAPRNGHRAGRLSLCWKLVGPWSGFVSRAAVGTTRLALVGAISLACALACCSALTQVGLLVQHNPGALRRQPLGWKVGSTLPPFGRLSPQRRIITTRIKIHTAMKATMQSSQVRRDMRRRRSQRRRMGRDFTQTRTLCGRAPVQDLLTP